MALARSDLEPVDRPDLHQNISSLERLELMSWNIIEYESDSSVNRPDNDRRAISNNSSARGYMLNCSVSKWYMSDTTIQQ
jgi:hypothetical protein